MGGLPYIKHVKIFFKYKYFPEIKIFEVNTFHMLLGGQKRSALLGGQVGGGQVDGVGEVSALTRVRHCAYPVEAASAVRIRTQGHLTNHQI